jgi:glucose/arabinose dehydrogenase
MKKPWIKRLRWLACLCAGFAVLIPAMMDASSTSAQIEQEPSSVTAIQLQPVVNTGLSSPVYVTNAHDGSNRLFIVEQNGIIKVLQPGQTTPTVFLNISSRVIQNGGERGLLGLAFHPQYASNGRFFVYYTRVINGENAVAEYRVSSTNSNVADTTEIMHISIAQPFGNHNGGMIEFGPDGYLYIAKGDGGDGNDPGNRAQNINILLGKLLRIDVNTPNGSVPYSSPADNPFFGATAGSDEIYAYGLRNPWRFSFDRGTGDLVVADVGQGAWEEIDIVTKGGNYGWRVFEGNHCTNLDATLCNTPSNYIFPIAEYGHTGGRCSITGGYVYRGSIGTFPTGAYIYGDLCTGEIFQLLGGNQTLQIDTSLTISSFGEDEAGEIYVIGIGGSVNRLVNTSATCTYSLSPATPAFRANGNTGSIVVTTPVNCTWTAQSNSSFINITAGTSGTGVGAVTYTVSPNPGALRTGTLTIAGQTITVTQGPKENVFDFEGDAKTDLAVWRPSASAQWLVVNSSTGNVDTTTLGTTSDAIVPGDYDGDWKTDTAIWRPSTGVWSIRNSSNGSTTTVSWGVNGDIPVPGDYDGDGKADIAIWRPSSGIWFIRNSSNGSVSTVGWGVNGDVPVPGDYDGDGKTDVANWRPSNGAWYIINSSNSSVSTAGWGVNGDKPVVGNYDGDGKADIAIWRPSTGVWYIINSSNGSFTFKGWGISTDVAVPGDYNADGKTDIAIWRPGTSATWYIMLSLNNTVRILQHGTTGDIPVPSAFVR